MSATAMTGTTNAAIEAGIEAGSIHIDAGGQLPKFLSLRTQSLLNSWPVVTNVRSTFEAEIKKAGWVFFFMAGKIERSAFGFDKRKTLKAALNRLTISVRSQKCNCFEIMDVTSKQFLGISRVSVSAHARHLQRGQVCLAP
jgi:hypothetical protein